MILFLTSSPCVPNADRAILNPVNGFVDRLKASLPPDSKCLFICSDPDSPELTDNFGQNIADAFAEAGMEFKEFTTLDRRNDEAAQALVALGYSMTGAVKVLKEAEITESTTVEDLLKYGLKNL